MINPFNKNVFMLKGALYEMILHLESHIVQSKIDEEMIDPYELWLYQDFIDALNQCNEKINYHSNLIYDHINKK